MERMQIGGYTVTFDPAGAHIEREGSNERYLVPGEQAKTTIAFVRHHWKLCIAMMRDHVAVLEPFKVEPPERPASP